MTIDGLDLSKYPRIDTCYAYQKQIGKKFIYLLNKEGDDTLFIRDANARYSFHSAEITLATATILDERTDQISVCRVYRDHIGPYIKKQGRKFRLEGFKINV